MGILNGNWSRRRFLGWIPFFGGLLLTLKAKVAHAISLNLAAFWRNPARGAHVFGANTIGQLGLGITAHQSNPVILSSRSDWRNIGGGSNTSVGLQANGTLWAWGNNTRGQLGQGNVTRISSPIQVGSATDWASTQIGKGGTIYAIKNSGALWGCGSSISGQLGNGTYGAAAMVSTPIQIGSDSDWATLAEGCDTQMGAIKTDGTIWTWGRNANGQLGLGTITDTSTPTQLGAVNTWTQLAGGYTNFAALKADGTIWAWGRNHLGQLGNGTILDASTPVQVGSWTDWTHIAAGGACYLARRSSGAIYAWGENANGQLGIGSTLNCSTPVQIGALTTWADIAAGTTHMAAIKTDGTLWTWGNNANGQLGLGNVTLYSVPTQVGSGTAWSFFSSQLGEGFSFLKRYM